MDGVFAAIRQGSAIEFRFAREDRHSHANSYTFYLSYEGPLPAAPARKEIKVDVTIKERIVFSLAKKRALRVYEGACPRRNQRRTAHKGGSPAEALGLPVVAPNGSTS